MKFTLHKLSREQWDPISENCHAAVFHERRPKEHDRCDYCLLITDDEKKLMVGYLTIRELDQDTAYSSFGGTFPEYRGTLAGVRGYDMFLTFLKSHYKQMSTLIDNENVAMLKLAARSGLKIFGIRNVQGKVLLEHGIVFNT